MNIITINARGLSKFQKFRRLIHKLSQFRPDIILIQEPIHLTRNNQDPSILTAMSRKWKTIWQGDIYITPHTATLIHHTTSSSFIQLLEEGRILDILINNCHGRSFTLRNVYAPANLTKKRQFWHEFPPLPSQPAIMAGDLNTILYQHDHISSTSHQIKPLLNLVLPHLNNLIDVANTSDKNPQFTCYRDTQTGWSRSRIDYIWAHPSLITSTQTTTTKHMGSDSDHRALILQAQTKHKSNIWRMNTSMLTNPVIYNKLEQNIQTALPSLSISSWDEFKSQIRTTCREMGIVLAKKRRDGIINLTNRIKKLQSSSSPNTHIIANLTRKLRDLEETASKAYAIRSRVRWYEEGETSSRYFYQRFKHKQQKSSISSLQIPMTIPPQIPSMPVTPNTPIAISPSYKRLPPTSSKHISSTFSMESITSFSTTSPTLIHSSPSSPTQHTNDTHISSNIKHILNYATDYYKQLWDLSPTLDTSSLQNHIPTISEKTKDELSKPFTVQEVLTAIGAKDNGSSPGPDGIPYELYKTFTTPLAHRLCKIFNEVANGAPPPPSWTKTHTILIPKKEEERTLIQNWRPITLANTDIKILSTILSNRFQTHAPYLIHKDQTGFMKNRHITDTILDINSLFTLPNLPHQSFLLLLDWAKAYDRVSHHWLDLILCSSNLPTNLQTTIRTTYAQRYTQLFINGHLGKSFKVAKGVPQGDPFAPILFNLSLEPLFNLLREKLQGIPTPIGTIQVRAYADDTYVFGSGPQDWPSLEQALKQYETAAGASVNWLKSTFIPLSSNTPSPPSTPTTSPEGPIKVLGILLPLSPSNIDSLWDTLVTKVQKRMTAMYSRSLSLRGRVLVCKSLLLSLTWYQASIVPPPPHHRKQLKRIIADFIWEKRKIHPKALLASLPTHLGGIKYPDIEVELNIRAAHLISKIFSPNPPFWAKAMNHITMQELRVSLPYLVFNQKSTHNKSEPRLSGLKACKMIEAKQPGTISLLPTLPELRTILLPPLPSSISLFQFEAHGTFSWEEVFHKDRPRKVADLWWKIVHLRLPVGISVLQYAPDGANCPWCENVTINIPHLFESCPTAQHVWQKTEECAAFLTPTNTRHPIKLLIIHPSSSHQQTGRLLQSAALYTIWKAYTHHVFGGKPTPTLLEIQQTLATLILSFRSTALAAKPGNKPPWPPVKSIIDSIRL